MMTVKEKLTRTMKNQMKCFLLMGSKLPSKICLWRMSPPPLMEYQEVMNLLKTQLLMGGYSMHLAGVQLQEGPYSSMDLKRLQSLLLNVRPSVWQKQDAKLLNIGINSIMHAFGAQTRQRLHLTTTKMTWPILHMSMSKDHPPPHDQQLLQLHQRLTRALVIRFLILVTALWDTLAKTQ